MGEIREKLETIAREQFGPEIAAKAMEGEQIFSTHGNDWTKDLDSLDRVEFVMAVEDEFHIEIPDSIVGSFGTMDDVARYVDVQTKGAANGGH